MARKSIGQRIAELEERKKALQARLTRQERARNTRRKMLLGALILDRLEANSDEDDAQRLRVWLKRELPDFLTHDGDKALLADLISIPGGSEAPEENG